MKLSSIAIRNYRSIRDIDIEVGDLTLFIGANASGKSAILDSLRFLSEAVRARDFRVPLFSRGGILNLAWKGQEAGQVELTVALEDGGKQFEWKVLLVRTLNDFFVEEDVHEISAEQGRIHLLHSRGGEGFWSGGNQPGMVSLQHSATACSLVAASVDASFPAREITDFVARWGFFDPSPFLLRRDWNLPDAESLDVYGRNLGETLHALPNHDLKAVVDATRSVVGLPTDIEPRESEDRFYFVQKEPGLQFTVNQMGVSSGTLRVLALMTALYAQPDTTLIGIEEPENYIHPSALQALVQHLRDATGRVQFMVTTHSPLLLDFLDEPAAVNVVKRDDFLGTVVLPESNPDGVRKALEASGFSLGQYHETKGFGG